MRSVLKNFLCSTEKLKQDALLHVLRTFNGWCNRCTEHVKHILFLRKFTDVLDVLLAQTWLLFFSEKTCDSSGDNLSAESASCHAHVHIWSGTIDASHLNTVARLDAINQVVLQDDSHAARKLAWRRALGHLLDGDHLRVLVQTVAVLVRQRVAVLVLDREGLGAIRALQRRVLAHLCQISGVVVVANFALLRGLAVVHRGLDHGLDEAHARHDAAH